MNKTHWAKFLMISIVILTIAISACVPYSKIKYFNDIDDLGEPAVNPMKSKVIYPFDKLHVTVLSTDEQTADLLNSYGQGNSDNAKGYVVDETGYIYYPFVGRIKVSGLTLLEAADKISKAMSGIITKPEVNVSLMDNMVTVMGEVGSQGRYLITGDFINIYQALALGGGLSQYADRKKVILLRNENNKLMYYKLDLTNSKIASSPLYYIIPNDIIIVEPLRKKSLSYQNPMISTVLTAITAILSILYITSIRGN